MDQHYKSFLCHNRSWNTVSGKSFGIIDPFIRQYSAKGFSKMVYDYKWPSLAKTLFY